MDNNWKTELTSIIETALIKLGIPVHEGYAVDIVGDPIEEFISQQITKAEDKAADGWFKYQSEIRTQFSRELVEKIQGMKRVDFVSGEINTGLYNETLDSIINLIKDEK